MEAYRKPTENKELRDALDHVAQYAFGLPIILNAVPTNDTMKAQTWGIYSTDIYIKFGNNVTLKFTGTNVA